MSHKHEWVCTDIPGVYNCYCKVEGYWNSTIREIEVAA
jgi:hypothetical protein